MMNNPDTGKPSLCYLDMDGVIVDLHGVVHKKFGIHDPADQKAWNEGKYPLSDEELWSGTDNHWWENLPWTSDGKAILKVVEEAFGKENVVICTKPARYLGSVEGKILWLQKNLPSYLDRYIITRSKHLCASYGKVLIDDSDGNVKKFREHDGRAILCPRRWNEGAEWADQDVPQLIAQLLKDGQYLRTGGRPDFYPVIE